MPRLPNALIYLHALVVPTRLKPDLYTPSKRNAGEQGGWANDGDRYLVGGLEGGQEGGVGRGRGGQG